MFWSPPNDDYPRIRAWRNHGPGKEGRGAFRRRKDIRPQRVLQGHAGIPRGYQQSGHGKGHYLRTGFHRPVQHGAFYQLAEKWSPKHEGLELLHQGLLLFTQEAPLPFLRRTLLEFVYPGEEGQAWWEGIAGMMQNFGVTLRPLCSEEVIQLANHIFNPQLD